MNPLLNIPPPVYALLSLAICKGLDNLFTIPLDISAPTLGTILVIPGLALVFWAWLHFFNNKTTPVPTAEPSALVEGGPYRYSRNPMYLGLLMILVGIVFFLGSPVYFLAPAGFFIVVDRLFVPYEEAKLERLFGSEYARLKIDIRRWL